MDPRDVFTVQLAQHMQERTPGSNQGLPNVQGSGHLIYGGSNLRSTVVGTTPAYTEVTNYKVRAGRFLHDLDLEHQTQVMVLGSRVAERLFGQANPVGEQITYVVGDRRYSFTVVGVMESKGQVLMGNYDNQVYIPLTLAMERILRTKTVSTLMAQAASAEAASEAVQQAEFLLYSRLGTADGFNVTSQDEMLETMGDVAFTLQLMLEPSEESRRCWDCDEHHAGVGERAYSKSGARLWRQAADSSLQFIGSVGFEHQRRGHRPFGWNSRCRGCEQVRRMAHQDSGVRPGPCFWLFRAGRLGSGSIPCHAGCQARSCSCPQLRMTGYLEKAGIKKKKANLCMI